MSSPHSIVYRPIRNGLFAGIALIGLVCAGLLGPGGANRAVAQESDPTAPTVPTVLDDPDFTFCHENADHRFNEVFCPLLDEVPEDRCAGLRAFCADPEAAPSRGCNASEMMGGGEGNMPSAPEEPSAEWDDPDLGCDSESEGCSGAGAVSTLLGWGVAILVALMIAGVAIALLRYLGLRPDTPTAPVRAVREPDDDEEQTFAEAVDDVPDLPSDALLREARSALASGDLGKSTTLARGAVLRRLGERRVIKLHRARTDREYVRQAGRAPDVPVEGSPTRDAASRQAIRSELQAVLDVAEQHRWGRIPLDVAGVEAALDAAARLLNRVSTPGAALLLLLGLATAPSHAANERYGPAGDVGIERVLDRYGFEVSYRLRALQGMEEESDDPDSPDVLVLDTSGLTPTEADWTSLRLWVEQGHVLWVTGDVTSTFPELGELQSTQDDLVLAGDLEAEGLATPVFPSPPGRGFSEGQPVLVDAADPLNGAAPIAWAAVGDGVVLAVIDPVLLWNGALVVPDNEAFLGDVLNRGIARGWPIDQPGRVQLATLAAAPPPENPAGSVANLNLLPFVLQVLALWIVVVWWRGLPFVPLRDPPSDGRRGFSEHVDALARQYARSARAGGGVHVAGAYAAWVLERVRRNGLVLAARRHGYSAEDADDLAERTVVLAEHFDASNPEDPKTETETREPGDAMSTLEELWNVMRPR